jgi:putative flippase GtrA
MENEEAVIPAPEVAIPEENKIKKLMKQFSKFFIIGVINTLVDIVILNIETIMTGAKEGAPYAIQKGFSFMVAVIFSYFMNKYWAFQDKNKEGEGRKFSQFIFVSLVGMAINMTVATLVVTYLKAPINGILHMSFLTDQIWVTVGALCGSASGLIWNFIGYKFWVFKK